MAESTDQMVLVGSPVFLNRVQYLSVQHARVVLAEALATAHHSQRANYAVVIVQQPASQAATIAVMLCGGTNLLPPETITGTAPNFDTSATDAEMLAQIATFWNPLAGIATGS